MLTISIDTATKLKLYFNYTKIPADRKQEVKGSRFRRRTTEAVLELHQGNTVHSAKLVGSAINDSMERFDRVHGREAALSSLTSGFAVSLPSVAWGLDIGSSKLASLLWDVYRTKCTRRVKPQFRADRTRIRRGTHQQLEA